MIKLPSKFGSRKFVLTAGVQVFSSIALAWGLLTGAEYTQITMLTIGAYNASNFGVAYVNKGNAQ